MKSNAKVQSTNGIMCNQCSDVLTASAQVCQCHNLAILIDQDGTFRIYVEDITTARRVILFTVNDKEISRELLPPFNSQVYIDTSYLTNNPINFQVQPKPKPKLEANRRKWNMKLIQALDLYNDNTSDGCEVFLPTALRDSKLPDEDD